MMHQVGEMCMYHRPNAPVVDEVPWDKRLDMRNVTLANFPLSSSAYRHHYRSHNNLVARSKAHVIQCPRKSLAALRVSLQKSLNQELHNVLEKYISNFFRPAAANISRNNGNVQVSEYHLQEVCRQILEEAKKMYHVGATQLNSSAEPLEKHPHQPTTGSNKRPAAALSRTNATANSNDDAVLPGKRMKLGKKLFKKNGHKGHSNDPLASKFDYVDRSGPRWDPDRLTTETRFVLGSRANKALGFGAMRGKLYSKHADLFRYIGDLEDKQWLAEKGHMPPSGGRAYLLIKQDIEDLLESDDYKNMPGVCPLDMGEGFIVPDSMIQKMKQVMMEKKNKSISTLKKHRQANSTHDLFQQSPSQSNSSLFNGLPES